MNISKKKSGTAYEILAGFVVRILNEQSVVVHDVKLRGDSEVKHQIDLVVNSAGTERRILVECKDFDRSGNKVGLNIIRDFSAAVADIKPQGALVVTCNGFTRDAEKFARVNQIALAILRLPKATEATQLESSTHPLSTQTTRPRVMVLLSDFDQITKYHEDLELSGLQETEDFWCQAPIQIRTAQGTRMLEDVIDTAIRQGQHRVDCTGGVVEVGSRGSITSLQTIHIDYEVIPLDYVFETVATRIVALIHQDLSGRETFIYDTDLQRYRLDLDGTISGLVQ